MKKILSIILLLVSVFAVSGTCSAIEREDLNIGGIFLGQRISEVFARYGQPAEVKHSIPNGRTCIFKINGCELKVSTTSIDDTGTVTGVKMTGDTGLAMEAGIKFGSTADEIIKAYGDNASECKPEARDFGVKGLAYSITLKTKSKYDTCFFFLDKDKKVIGIEFWHEDADC